MLVAAAVCPHPPLLHPEVSRGAATEVTDLLAACDAAVTELRDLAPDRIVVVGRTTTAGPLTATGGTFAAYGPDVRVGSGEPNLPLPHTVGCWLLDRTGWDRGRYYVGVADEGSATGAAAEVRESADRVALVVMGDASARRSEKAPGYVDDRAAGHDAAVTAAFVTGPQAVRALDGRLADELLAGGWPAWQTAAHAAGERPWRAHVRYDGAPYGVGYLVISLGFD